MTTPSATRPCTCGGYDPADPCGHGDTAEGCPRHDHNYEQDMDHPRDLCPYPAGCTGCDPTLTQPASINDRDPRYVHLPGVGRALITGYGVMSADGARVYGPDEYAYAHEYALATDGHLAPVIG